ncbi:hypothetical protein BDN72DRAFT_130753 [Pluteus cervinus]|uniref:Uncharacterized protein n=1 Tax=Pluteus cervinus TaxID=181527 RepID=A0ACD3AMK0_9AGAR|nr:hypothetical protein BDN72DRAFT_130753 [Pluteus cervinus]
MSSRSSSESLIWAICTGSLYNSSASESDARCELSALFERRLSALDAVVPVDDLEQDHPIRGQLDSNEGSPRLHQATRCADFSDETPYRTTAKYLQHHDGFGNYSATT